jgi:hypothetical protein
VKSALPEGGLLAFNGKSIDHAFAEFQALSVCAKLNNFGNLFMRVTVCLYDQTAGGDETEKWTCG